MSATRTRTPRLASRRQLVVGLLALLVGSGLPYATPPTSVHAQTNNMTLQVVSARTESRAFGGAGVEKGDSVGQFKYIINVDNTGTTGQRPDPITGAPPAECTPADAGYPDSCDWISIAGSASNAPIFAQGDQGDFASGGVSLPDGRYLISVLADGYRLDGVHFTVPLADPGLVTVELQPFPLPDATIRAFVFEDISPTNGAPDVPAEAGLAGFVGRIADYIGEVTTDVYGNPLCTRYEGEDPDTFVIPPEFLDADMLPVPIPGSGGRCVSDANGMLAIPHVGPNRYALSVVKPDGTDWIQTTTLEGNHDWDAWVMEGSTGYDTEFVVAGEPFPAIIFGYVHPNPATDLGGSGTITGVVDAFKTYIPAKGGVIGGEPMIGSKIDKPIDSPWLSLSDLQNGDTAVWVGQGDANGAFTIPNVPAGNYTLTWWDEPQDYILNLTNVTVADGEVVDLGVIPVNGWWTTLEGYVFNDANRNGIRDAGEQGLDNYSVVMRKRENSVMDRGAVLVSTGPNPDTGEHGYYFMENLYPMTQWLVVEAYSDLYYTTGVTYQADNQSQPTTVLGAGVDVSILPIIGLGGRLDWGVHAYDAVGANGIDPQNGGIAGTVSYDTTRNEIDPRYAAVEDWQPGVSGLTVNLYAPVDCPDDGLSPCDATGRYQLATDGSYLKGQLINSTVTETWQRPGADGNANGDGNCVPRDVNGDPLLYPADQQVTNSDTDCLEAPLMGVQFQMGYSTVDGNYGFGDGCFDGILDATDPSAPTCTDGNGNDVAFTPLDAGDYLVDVVIPTEGDQWGAAAANPDRSLYQVTREEDINIANGDQFVPQIPPPACVGPLHTVDVAGIGTDGYGENTTFIPGVTVPASTPVENATFAAELGGSYYEGQPKPLCSTKLVTVSNGRSTAPTFNLFTDVPLPGRFWGLLVDDLNFSSNPRSTAYGEKAGVPFAPVGIYDWTNRLITTVESDYNGLWDVLLPSTNRINCPTPSGVCAGMYRAVGNDPGIPGRLNANFKPQFRTIAAEFESLPGLIVPADLAPTQVGLTAQLPSGQFNLVACTVNDPAGALAKPELFAVSQPYVNGSGSFAITGQGFGSGGQVTLDGIALPTTAWSDTSITVSVPATTPVGPHQLRVTRADNGNSTINGLTFHVLGLAAFPSTPVLDDFNRTGFGTSWNASSAFSLSSPTGGNTSTYNVRVTGTGTMRWGGSTGGGPVYGSNQEAYFTFYKVSPTATEQGLFLKVTGNGQNPNPTDQSAAYIEVSYNAPAQSVQVRTKANGTNTVVLQATFSGVTFAANDTLGARALADGTVIAYRNGVEVGRVNVASTASPWPAANATGDGRLGIRFVGAQSNTTNDARFDNFGGGTVSGYTPNIYEVGSGKTYAVIQDAIDAAAASNGDDLVVVYPGTPDPGNPRLNPRGAYYENLIISAPVKLQGVGPGGIRQATGTTVPGSIIDGSAYGGDTALADAWRARIAALAWVGNQPAEMSEGEAILLLAQTETQYGATFKAAIDGFDIRGGDQQGQANIITQGGAIYAHAYIRNLQVTNNVIQGNSGSYGTVRIGTPDLPAPDTSQHNENLRIANNRLIHNAGTNLGGAIALFAGADNYEVAGNDLCGNFSAEYGGGISHYGLSRNGRIHDNRIYFNESYDEGGGIMIAGQLPADPATLSPGSGPVDIYSNLIQNNMSGDDGGGIRFLMAGNFPINVYNNIVVNNVSTHEGGGIGLNDAPNVRVFNNTIMKNLTTATAVTSLGFPAPAGLSSSANSDQLQATLPGGSPQFSNPLLFNNIFWDNRAGTRAGGVVTGLSDTDANHWDLGVADFPGLLAPTNSIVQQNAGVHPYTTSPSNSAANPLVMSAYDVALTFAAWRNNPAFVDAIMVVNDLPPNLLGDYHLQPTSPAKDAGAVSKAVPAYQQPPASLSSPAFDIDGDLRPAFAGFDIGADEIPARADLSITKTDNQSVAYTGGPVTYTIVASNAGPDPVTGATVSDTFPASLSGVTWTCAATGGSSCPASGSGNLSAAVDLAVGGSATFTATGTLAATASGTLSNTASVAVPAGFGDPNPANNSATDTDSIPTADLSITKTDNQSVAYTGGPVTYTIVASNAGPDPVTGATVSDTFPASLSGVTWTCTATGGSSCPASGSGNLSAAVNLAVGGSATFTATGTLAADASGTLSNTASVALPAGFGDPNPANNSATDTDTIEPPLPALGVLDNFNRANATTLGANWSQTGTSLRIGGSSYAFANNSPGSSNNNNTGVWSGASPVLGAAQGAAFTFANTTLTNAALILKARYSSDPPANAALPLSFVRVRYQTGTGACAGSGNRVCIATTTDGGATYTAIGWLAGTFASGDTLMAVVRSDGSVDVWRTTGASVTTYLGRVTGTGVTGGGAGRIGIQLGSSGTRIDNFSGGTLP